MAIDDFPIRTLTGGPDETTPKYWFANDVFLTHFFNAISSTFPEGERFFIRSVRHFADRVEEEQLKRQVAAFVGQEGQHSKAHDGHNQLLINQGYTVLKPINRNQRVISNWFNRHAPSLSLALTTAVEHITATFANQILADPEKWTDPMHPAMQKLWRWHAVEETEHKAVAFDVYQLTVQSVWLRRFAMMQASVGFLVEVFLRHSLLLIKDRAFEPGILWAGCHALFGKQGYLRVLIPSLGSFYAGDFHPWQQDNTELLRQRRAQWKLQS